MLISSAQNSKIKLVKRLRRKRGRQQTGRFVIDCERDLRRARRQAYDIDFMLHDGGLAAQSDYPGVDAHELPPALFKRLSYRENPERLIAVMRAKPTKGLPQWRRTSVDAAIVLVNPAVPGNIGALMRSADAAGFDAVILVDMALDLYNPNIIRSSTGACFGDNIYQMNGDEALAALKSEGFQLVAADAAGGRTVYDIDFRPKTAIALGAEDRGLPPAWLEAADEVARVPMKGDLSDSLNVSVCGALFMYEIRRPSLAPSQKG